jgi:hypothetical protein
MIDGHSSAGVQPKPPARPVSVYVDPADRVAQTPVKVQADNIRTWAVSEVDKKGKKKKGTLGIGNGSIFFASESDKVSLSSSYNGCLFTPFPDTCAKVGNCRCRGFHD